MKSLIATQLQPLNSHKPFTLLEALQAPYKDGARGEDGFYDCWGLARKVRAEVYGKSLLLELAGANRFDLKDMQNCYKEQTAKLKIIKEPVAGAIVGVIKKGLCVHAAVIVENNGKLCVLDTNPITNSKIYSLTDYQQKFFNAEIIYYD